MSSACCAAAGAEPCGRSRPPRCSPISRRVASVSRRANQQLALRLRNKTSVRHGFR
jgi:hypothetical protein